MRGFFIALTFLTRIPLPPPKKAVPPDAFARSLIYYPLVGLLLGLLLWLGAKTFAFYFPPLTLAALLLCAELALTGGLHLDGFMDSMDGLLAARSPERALEIMQDSHVGAHACIALVGLLILKVSLLSGLSYSQYAILLVMPMISRWVFQIGVIGFPYAREEGLGKELQTQTRSSFWIMGCLVLGLSFYFAGFAGLIAFGVSAITVTLIASRVSAFLGGLTGDVYGALIEISEVVCLLAAFPFMS